LLRSLAENKTEGKGEIELPAREVLADMLMEMNRPEDALTEFEKSMKVDPNRFNALTNAQVLSGRSNFWISGNSELILGSDLTGVADKSS
jgi:hypothetical protein